MGAWILVFAFHVSSGLGNQIKYMTIPGFASKTACEEATKILHAKIPRESPMEIGICIATGYPDGTEH